MKKYIFFFVLGTLCAITSLFISSFNFGMLLCFTIICFLFGRSFSEKKPKVQKKKHEAIDWSEIGRADDSVMVAMLITGGIAFGCVSLKTFFFIWELISRENYEQPIYALATIVIMIAPCFAGYHAARIIEKIKSFKLQVRID